MFERGDETGFDGGWEGVPENGGSQSKGRNGGGGLGEGDEEVNWKGGSGKSTGGEGGLVG